MNSAIKHRVRAILRRSSVPLTASSLAERMGEAPHAVTNALRRMPDAYIASWTTNINGQWVMEWAVVKVPPHAPKPDRGKNPTNGEKICV